MSGSWSGKKITVLGLGRSGSSAAQFLKQRGADVLLSESKAASGEKLAEVAKLEAAAVKVETGGHSEAALQADLVVVSPGIPPTAQIIKDAVAQGKEVISDIELASRELGQATQIIGITGTNGKSTTCAMTSYLLERAGFSAPACGNIGVPILDQLERQPNFLVAEVSSYQLHYCTTFAPKIGVWLNLTPDHIDWHGSLNAYIADKQKMFLNQRKDQFAVLNQDDPVVAQFFPPSEIYPFAADRNLDGVIQGAWVEDDFMCYRLNGKTRLVCRPGEMKIIGKHNIENALAVISVAALLEVPHEKIVDAVKSFTALEHRLEFAGTIDGVDFFNDSKATNPTSTIKALQAFGDRKVVLIAGGKDKGTSLDELVDVAKQHVSAVILLGEAKQRFAQAFEEGGYGQVHSVASLEEAVELGRSLKLGPVVLSPACASFDMFKDYEERGRVFKNLVRARLEKLASSH